MKRKMEKVADPKSELERVSKEAEELMERQSKSESADERLRIMKKFVKLLGLKKALLKEIDREGKG